MASARKRAGPNLKVMSGHVHLISLHQHIAEGFLTYDTRGVGRLRLHSDTQPVKISCAIKVMIRCYGFRECIYQRKIYLKLFPLLLIPGCFEAPVHSKEIQLAHTEFSNNPTG